jgi:hypothetical protein
VSADITDGKIGTLDAEHSDERLVKPFHASRKKLRSRANSLQSHGEIKLQKSNRFNSDRVPSGSIIPAITTLVVEPLFSGFPESIFHADPHAGNLMVQTQKHPSFTLVLSDWGRDGPALCAAALPLIVRGSFYGKEEMLCICKKLVDPLRKSMRRFLLKLRNHPEPPSQEKKRKKHESYSNQKSDDTLDDKGTSWRTK